MSKLTLTLAVLNRVITWTLSNCFWRRSSNRNSMLSTAIPRNLPEISKTPTSSDEMVRVTRDRLKELKKKKFFFLGMKKNSFLWTHTASQRRP